MSIFTDSLAAELRSLTHDLASLGIATKHPKDCAAVTAAIDAYDDLESLGSRALAFTAPTPDNSDLVARLAAGEEVSDTELIDYAARTTAAGTKIAPAVQSIVGAAQSVRGKAARDTLRGIFPQLIDDFRATLTDAGDAPSDAEALTVANNNYLKEQERKRRETIDNPTPIRMSHSTKPRTLRRDPLPSSGYEGLSITAADLDDYQAAKASGELTR